VYLLSKFNKGKNNNVVPHSETKPAEADAFARGAEKLDYSKYFGLLIGLAIVTVNVVIIFRSADLSFMSLNFINLSLLGLGFILHGSISSFLKALNLDFKIQLQPVDEVYPKSLKAEEITDYLAQLKSEPFKANLRSKTILITSDTIVWLDGKAIEKPKHKADAFRMLKTLSGKTHEVITSICFSMQNHQKLVNTVTKVTFRTLTDDEMWYYVNTFKPLDKAGAYGIQEWIGSIAITHIEGSYNNVVGLPTHLLYETLNSIADGF
jgi:septum formation protein